MATMATGEAGRLRSRPSGDCCFMPDSQGQRTSSRRQNSPYSCRRFFVCSLFSMFSIFPNDRLHEAHRGEWYRKSPNIENREQIPQLPPLTTWQVISELERRELMVQLRRLWRMGHPVRSTVQLAKIARLPHVQPLSHHRRARRLFQVSKFPGISSSPLGGWGRRWVRKRKRPDF
jgi:hypothetical protein